MIIWCTMGLGASKVWGNTKKGREEASVQSRHHSCTTMSLEVQVSKHQINLWRKNWEVCFVQVVASWGTCQKLAKQNYTRAKLALMTPAERPCHQQLSLLLNVLSQQHIHEHILPQRSAVRYQNMDHPSWTCCHGAMGGPIVAQRFTGKQGSSLGDPTVATRPSSCSRIAHLPALWADWHPAQKMDRIHRHQLVPYHDNVTLKLLQAFWRKP